VIHFFDRLWYLVNPDEYVLVFPWFHEIGESITLKSRGAKADLTLRQSRDGVPVETKCSIRYRVDIRNAEGDFIFDAVRFTDDIWEAIVRSRLDKVAREVIGGLPLAVLLTANGQRHVQERMSRKLSLAIRKKGVRVNPGYGVTIVSLLPKGRIWDAMVEKIASVSLGEAAKELAGPMMEDAEKRTGLEALLYQWAAAIARHEKPPQVVLRDDLIGEAR